MIWTRTKPTKAGWWWYRSNKDDESDIVFLTKYKKSFLVNNIELKYIDGEWSSEPIQEPTEPK